MRRTARREPTDLDRRWSDRAESLQGSLQFPHDHPLGVRVRRTAPDLFTQVRGGFCVSTAGAVCRNRTDDLLITSDLVCSGHSVVDASNALGTGLTWAEATERDHYSDH